MKVRATTTSPQEKTTVTRTYRLERWITGILLTLFVIPFVAEAENFYAAALTKQKAKITDTALVTADKAGPALPEDLIENAIDQEPGDDEASDDSCC